MLRWAEPEVNQSLSAACTRTAGQYGSAYQRPSADSQRLVEAALAPPGPRPASQLEMQPAGGSSSAGGGAMLTSNVLYKTSPGAAPHGAAHADPLLAAIAARVGGAGIGPQGSAAAPRRGITSQDVETWVVPFAELTFDRQVGQGPSSKVRAMLVAGP